MKDEIKMREKNREAMLQGMKIMTGKYTLYSRYRLVLLAEIL